MLWYAPTDTGSSTATGDARRHGPGREGTAFPLAVPPAAGDRGHDPGTDRTMGKTPRGRPPDKEPSRGPARVRPGKKAIASELH